MARRRAGGSSCRSSPRAAAPTNTLPANPGGAEADIETGGSEPRARGPANLVRRPAPQRRHARPGRARALHRRRQPRRDARRRRPPRRGVRADPVRADDAARARAARPGGPAADQQVLLHGSRPRPQLRRARRRRGHPVLHDQLAQPGPEQGDWDLDTYAAAVLRAIDVGPRDHAAATTSTRSACAPAGSLTAAPLGHLAATGDDRVRSASFGVTLLDFEIPAAIGLFDSPASCRRRASSPRASGVLDGRASARCSPGCAPTTSSGTTGSTTT